MVSQSQSRSRPVALNPTLKALLSPGAGRGARRSCRRCSAFPWASHHQGAVEDDAVLRLAALPVFVVQRGRLGDVAEVLAGSVLPHPKERGRGLAGWKGAGSGAGRGREAPEEEAHVGEKRLHQADRAEGRAGGVEVHFVLIRAGGLEAVLGAGGAEGGRGCEQEQRLPGCRERTRSPQRAA